MITPEKAQGIDGLGQNIWMVRVMNSEKRCIWIHTFYSECERDNFIKHAY